METFVTRKGILRPAGAEDKRESGANPGQFPLLYALYAAGESSSHCPAGDGKAACGSVPSQKTLLCACNVGPAGKRGLL